MHSEHHHLSHNHIHWPKTWWEIWDFIISPEMLAFIMGGLASLSLGIVACIAFYTVLGWGGWPLAIITGVAALFTEGVIYLTDMPFEFKKYCYHGMDRDLRNYYMADYLLKDESKKYPEKKTLVRQIDEYIENRRKESDNKNSGFDAADDFFRSYTLSYLSLIYNQQYTDAKQLLLISFYRQRILFYIAMLFALGSGICFGVVGFTHCTIAFSFLLGFAAAATPWWVILLASITAFAAAFTYTMLMASSLNKLFNGEFLKFWVSIKNIFIPGKSFKELTLGEKAEHITKAILKCLLLGSIVVAVVLVGMASGGMLMDAASNVFVATAQLAAPLIDYIATIITWVFWIPLMVLFLLFNSWRSLLAIGRTLMKLKDAEGRAEMKRNFLANLPKDKRLIPFYVLGFLVAFFFFSMHVISEGALAGEGAKGEADFFSNVFLRFSEFITFIFKMIFFIPAVTIAVVVSTVVEILEDLPYFTSDEDEEHEGHDHHTFIIAVFGSTGGAIINFFSHHALPKLLGVIALGIMMELLVSATAAWIGQSTFSGISAAMAPSMFAFSALLLVTLVVIIYFSVGHGHGHYGKLGSGLGGVAKDFNPAHPDSLKCASAKHSLLQLSGAEKPSSAFRSNLCSEGWCGRGCE